MKASLHTLLRGGVTIMPMKKHTKKFIVVLCAIVFLNMFVLVDNPFSYAASPDLFISEYVEGTSNNKAIEIYNNTGSPVDLAASGYSIRIYFNGSSSAGTTVNLNGIIGAGNTYVIVQSLASPALLALANQVSTASWFNGDDAIVLMKGATTVDRFGTIGVDPGTAWTGGGTTALDKTLVRNPNITQGDTNTAGAFNPSLQWVQSPIDTFVNLGSHTLTTYLVNFDLGLHGTAISGTLSQTVKIGDNAIPPTVQANEGYTFTGWDIGYTAVSADLTVVAQYTKNVYTVNFVAGEHGEFDPTGQPATQQVLYGDPAAAPTVVTDQGYTFAGWDKTFDVVSGDMDVTAQYLQNTYSVIFKIGEGAAFDTSGGAQEQSLKSGNAIMKPVDPTRAGYSFEGWYVDANYTQKYVFVEGIQSDLVLYAKWIESSSQGFPYQGSPNQGSPSNGFPYTGDDSSLMILLILCCISVIGMGIQYRSMRKS
jgi:uncharacterized repeat protein (TIGR02543 family)